MDNSEDLPSLSKPVSLCAQCNEEGSEALLLTGELMVVDTSRKRQRSSVRIMQSKSCRYDDERTLIVRSHMGERAVYYIGVSRARPNQALARATE